MIKLKYLASEWMIMRTIDVGSEDEPLYDVSEWFIKPPFVSPRKEQSQVIPLIIKELAKGTKNIIVESPTGSGKSALSYMIPKITDLPAYVLTHLKGLQDQYRTELPEMSVVKGRGNYSCWLNVPPNCTDEELVNREVERVQNQGPSDSDRCSSDMAPCKTIKNFNCPFRFSIEELNPEESFFSDNSGDFCGYFNDLHDALFSRYFLTNMNYMASSWVHGHLPQRPLLVVDEAHNLESALMSHFSLDLSLKQIGNFLRDDSSFSDNSSELLANWRPNQEVSWGFPNLPSIRTDTDSRSWSMGAKVFSLYFKSLSGKIAERLERKKIAEDEIKNAEDLVLKLTQMSEWILDWENWVWTKNDELNPSRITFKTLSVRPFAEGLIHKAIKSIAWKHKGEKGLILPYTKSNQQAILDAMNQHFPMVARRLRTHSDDSEEREQDFKSFDLSDSDDIMISTYANQGYDGKDVGFCIIVKVPFRSLGDIQVKKRTEMNDKWYKSQTANTLTQMCGRVVRGRDNKGSTYIIDPTFDFHFDKGIKGDGLRSEMPKYLVESIVSNRSVS
jgi:Rad3-related DNA helicase